VFNVKFKSLTFKFCKNNLTNPHRIPSFNQVDAHQNQEGSLVNIFVSTTASFLVMVALRPAMGRFGGLILNVSYVAWMST
jgi:hypothetical protein